MSVFKLPSAADCQYICLSKDTGRDLAFCLAFCSKDSEIIAKIEDTYPRELLQTTLAKECLQFSVRDSITLKTKFF